MTQEADRSCKRCSVARVNALIEAYHNALGSRKDVHQPKLRKLIAICESQGFGHGRKLLTPGLDKKELRSICWNVASFLQDAEVERILEVKL